MTDYMVPATPDLSRNWCPECEPDRDPFNEILIERRCTRHEPQMWGDADSAMSRDDSYPYAAETDGYTNKLFCDFFHRRNKP